MQPLTIVAYTANHDSILDLLSKAACAAAGVSFDDLACVWELIAYEAKTPPSWVLADKLIARGCGRHYRPFFRRWSVLQRRERRFLGLATRSPAAGAYCRR